MKERKQVLISSKNQFTFVEEMVIEVEREGAEVTLRLPELNICTTNITKFTELFENIYFEIEKTDNFSEEKLKMKRYLDNLDITCSPVKDKKKKKRVNSRSKGARGERLVIEKLKEEHFNNLNILRTPGSGAFATVHDVRDMDGNNMLCGDLMASNDGSEDFKRFIKYNWEVKNYKIIPCLVSLTYKTSEPIAEWIAQAERDSNLNNRVFTIIFRANRSPEYIVFHTEHVKEKPFYKDELISFKYNDKRYSIFFLNKVYFE